MKEREALKRLRRVILAQWDLEQARRFAEAFLRASEREDGDDDAVVREALSLAAVVAYVRPFTHNEDKADATRMLDNDQLSELSGRDRRLHARLQSLRNQEFAHSDTRAHGLIIHNDGESAVSTGRRDGVTLTDGEMRKLLRLIDGLCGRLVEERDRLRAELPPGQY